MSRLIMQYFLNDDLDHDELVYQMDAMATAGFDGVYPHARCGLTTPYFSESWWAAMTIILDACRRHGLEFWIWDEDYYPSGLAGGRIVWEDPGLIARGLEFTIRRVEGEVVEADFAPGHLLRAFAVPMQGGAYGEPVDVTAHCGTRRQRWTMRQVIHRAYSPTIHPIGHPHWRASIADNRYALHWAPPSTGEWTIVGVTVKNAGGVHPDILRPEAIQRFLELAHIPYHERYAEEFGQCIRGAFTDEPSPGAGTFPWTARFDDAFQADHGYSLLPHLAHLALSIDDRTPAVRHHYRQTQHRLQKACYVDAISDWCEAHGIPMIGHLTRTEWLSLVAANWPNELRMYQTMRIPAADPLGGSLGWPDSAAYHTGLKVASSAAHLFGREQASTDVLAVIGEEARLRDLRYLLDYHLVMGINHFTLHGASYSFAGPRKDEVPPSLFVQHSEFRHFRTLTDHVKRLCDALTGGEHVCEIALLYPSTSLACQLTPGTSAPDLPDEHRIHALVETLLSHQIDFDFIDEITLDEVVDEDGELATAEPYRILILPCLRWIDERAAAAITRFAKRGRVIAVGEMPQALPATPTAPIADWDGGLLERVAQIQECLDELPRQPLDGAGARDVFALTRRRDEQTFTLLVNRGEEPFEGTFADRPVTVAPRGSRLLVSVGGERQPDELDAVMGEPVVELTDGWTVAFEPNQVPLGFWHVEHPARAADGISDKWGLPGFDLLNHGPDPAGDAATPARYWCRFMLRGEPADARLWLDPEALGGDWTMTLNGTPVSGWKRVRRFDHNEREADVRALLRSGSNPTLNVLRIECEGAGRGLREVPYLLGSFTCDYRYSHPSFPFLAAVEPDRTLPLHDWSNLGYPTFSGTAAYRREVVIDEPGDLWVDLGRVEDVAVVRWDGEKVATLGWPPYRCRLMNVTGGRHTLEVQVTNPPANRTRLARQAAGLLGPVRLRRG